MSADRKLAETIAEGRRLIAEATADRVLPLKKTVREGYNTLIEADGAPLAMTDGDGSAYVEDCAVDVVAFAVAHLAALLDVAEAADRMNTSRLVGEHWCADPCATCERIAALDSALSKLRGVRS